MRKHLPEMIADWAKEHQIDNWEYYWKAYHPTEVEKRRQKAIRDHNRRNRDRSRQFDKRYKT